MPAFAQRIREARSRSFGRGRSTPAGQLITETGCKHSGGQSAGWPHFMGDPTRKHLKFAAGGGVVLAVIFLIAAIVEPFVGELKMQSILVPVNGSA